MMNVAFNPIQQSKQQPGFSGKQEIVENFGKALMHSVTAASDMVCAECRHYNSGRMESHINAALSDGTILKFLKDPGTFLEKQLLLHTNEVGYLGTAKGSLSELASYYGSGFNEFADYLTQIVKSYVNEHTGSALYGKKGAIVQVDELIQKIKPKAQ
ncbi:MAG: hypothetical protein WCG23_01970 [bacterium]